MNSPVAKYRMTCYSFTSINLLIPSLLPVHLQLSSGNCQTPPNGIKLIIRNSKPPVYSHHVALDREDGIRTSSSENRTSAEVLRIGFGFAGSSNLTVWFSLPIHCIVIVPRDQEFRSKNVVPKIKKAVPRSKKNSRKSKK